MSGLTNRIISDLTNRIMSGLTNRIISDLTNRIMSGLTNRIMSGLTNRIISGLTNNSDKADAFVYNFTKVCQPNSVEQNERRYNLYIKLRRSISKFNGFQVVFIL